MNEKYDEEIFDNTSEASAVVWWLVNLLGGEVIFPLEREFYDENFPLDASLVLFQRDGKLILKAERLDG